MKLISVVRYLGAVVVAVFAASANANLIVNGGFEDNNVAAGSWNYYSAAAVNGWSGSNVEIWDSYGGVVAAEGTQHAELNAHPYTGTLFSIYQDFATVIGQTYDVSFFYRARSSNAEAFRFTLASLNVLLTDHVVGQWSQYSDSFVASNTSSRIRFTTTDKSTVGNFLDGIVVLARATVPESGSLVLFVVGLLGLAMVRRRTL